MTLRQRHERHHPAAIGFFTLVLAGAATLVGPSALAAQYGSAQGDKPLARADARLAWQTNLTLSFTGTIKAYYTADGHLYAPGTDGQVGAIRMDTGKRLWRRPILTKGERLWSPAPYRWPGGNGVALTLPDKVIFLNPATGTTLHRAEKDDDGETQMRPMPSVALRSASIAAVAVSTDHVFATAAGRRLRRYDIDSNYQSWQLGTKELLRLAPVYSAEHDLLLLIDAGGQLVARDATERKIRFTQSLNDEPIGWMALDADTVYVATAEPRLYAIDLVSGKIRFEHQLTARPLDGPTVTDAHIYQATVDGQLHCVGKTPEQPNWIVPQTRRFLAEWPGRVVLQKNDGQVLIVRQETGEPLATFNPGPELVGLSNPHNDAVVLGSPKGQVRCYRPVDADALTLADFLPPTPAEPSDQEPGEEADLGEEIEAEDDVDAFAETDDETEPPAEPGLSGLEELIADPLRSKR